MTVNNSSECLVLGATTWMPHIILKGDPSDPVITGTMTELWKILALHLGFCYRFVVPADLAAGIKLPNGTWNGIVELIIKKKADATALAFVATPDRAKDTEIGEYLYIEEHSAAYSRPQLQSDITGFMKPFTSMIWLLVLGSMIIIFMTSFLVRVTYGIILKTTRSVTDIHETNYRSRHRPNNDGNMEHQDLASSLNEAAIWTLASLLSQSIPKNPVGDSVRIISCLWLLISLILATVYRSNLKAMLILPKVTVPFDNLDQLVASNLPVWVLTDSMLHGIIKRSMSNTSLGQLSKQLIGVDAPTNVAWGLRGLIAGKFALCAPRSAIVQILHGTFSETGKCANYMMSEGFLKSTCTSFLYQKGSPWKAKIDPLIIRLRETGILDHIYEKGVHNATECLKPVNFQGKSSLRPMEMEDFFGVFLIYIIGLCIATMTFCMETKLGSRKK